MLTTDTTSWLDSAAPNWLSVLVLALVPLIAFGLPWLLARRQSGRSGKARRTAILVAAVPVLMGWLVLNSVLAPAHHVAPKPEQDPDTAIVARNPRSVLELLIRAGVGAGGAALILWAIGSAAGRGPREPDEIPDA